jgi:hypothetical protein
MISVAAIPIPTTSLTTPSIRHTFDFGSPARNTSCHPAPIMMGRSSQSNQKLVMVILSGFFTSVLLVHSPFLLSSRTSPSMKFILGTLCI